MEPPPKIAETMAKTVPIEVLPPEPSSHAAASDSPPIHALSALVLVAVDSLWAIFEWAPPLWLIAIPFCFIAVFLPTLLIQKHLKGDSTSRALTFATLLATLAAIPTFVTGTPVGLALLGWTGMRKLLHRRGP